MDTHSREYERFKVYYDSSPEKAWHVGIVPIGSGDLLEVPYRHYWEFRRFEEIVRQTNSPLLSVLELGCGAGRWAQSLIPMVQNYVGVDLSATQIDVARQVCDCGGSHPDVLVRFIEADISTFEPLENDRFSLIYTSGVIQYLTDTEVKRLIKKMMKYLAKDGFWIDRSTVVTERERLVRDTPEYFSIYRTPDEVIGLFLEKGFSCLTRCRSYRYLYPFKFWRKRIVRKMTRLGMRYMPACTFKAMEWASAIMESYKGETGREDDGVMYSHDFFVFSMG